MKRCLNCKHLTRYDDGKKIECFCEINFSYCGKLKASIYKCKEWSKNERQSNHN